MFNILYCFIVCIVTCLTSHAAHFDKYLAHPDSESFLYGGQLQSFWAQEYIGADLAIRWIENLGLEKQPVSIGIIDIGINASAIPAHHVKTLRTGAGKKEERTHGTAVANLIAGDAPIGTTAVGYIVSICAFPFYTEEAYEDALKQMTSDGAQIVSASLGFKHSPRLREALEKFGAQTIFVVSAGNYYQNIRIEFSHQNPELDNAIIVGNLSPLGIVAHDSSESTKISIAAPSQNCIQSRLDNKGSPIRAFGGTSGATPLVSGTLANVLYLIPDLDMPSAKILLEKTAIPTLNAFEQKGMRRNGAGMLNAYKMVRVADRLLADREWNFLTSPTLRQDYLRNHDEIFDFTKDAKKYLAQALLLRDAGHHNAREIYNLVRAAFLLDPHNREIRGELARIYADDGLTIPASFIRMLDYPHGTSEALQSVKRLGLPATFEKDINRATHWLDFGIRDNAIAAAKTKKMAVVEDLLSKEPERFWKSDEKGSFLHHLLSDNRRNHKLVLTHPAFIRYLEQHPEKLLESNDYRQTPFEFAMESTYYKDFAVQALAILASHTDLLFDKRQQGETYLSSALDRYRVVFEACEDDEDDEDDEDYTDENDYRAVILQLAEIYERHAQEISNKDLATLAKLRLAKTEL